MKRHRITAAAILLSLTWSSGAVAQSKLTLDDYYGKWDLELSNTGSSFSACSLSLNKAHDDGGIHGELVWRWGGVWRFRDSKAVEVDEKGNLLLKNQRMFREPLRLRRIGDSVEGVALQGKNTFYVKGWKARREVDPTGSWDLSIFLEDSEQTGKLRISRSTEKHADYSAKAWNSEGEEVAVTSVGLKGNDLKIAFRPEEDVNLKLEAKIQGDRLSGRLHLPDGKIVEAEGRRERKWGKPISLLGTDGLDGWHPRDQSRRFKWTCENGVLSNGEHDVDIVCDREFGDFKLNLEYKVEKENANSGIYLRGRYEVQIIGNSKLHKNGNCAVYDRLPPSSNPFKGVGEWNQIEITLVDRFLTIDLNGQSVQDNVELKGITGGALRSREHEPGPFMLQGDHGKIYFRNIDVRPLLR